MSCGTFLQNAEKLPRHASEPDVTTPLVDNAILICSAHVPAPVLYGLPHPPAAPSLGIYAHHVLGFDALVRTPCGHSMTHRNLLPVRQGTPAMRPPLSQRSCTADSLSNNRRSTLWKLRRTLPVRLRIIRGLPVLNQAADESSLTVFSIYKFQKIVNTVEEIFSGVD